MYLPVGLVKIQQFGGIAVNNAAIITFNKSSLPKLLDFFAVPRDVRDIEIGAAEEKTKVHLIQCPVMPAQESNFKLGKSLIDLCREKDISFFVGKNTEYYQKGGMSGIESRVTRGDIEEIKAIKDLGALIKLSAERKVNLLKRNMCFIGESISYQYICTMSEEASGVIIYEHEKMDTILKKSMFERLMADKGISAVFTKDLGKAVAGSEIIMADNTVELKGLLDCFTGKILIGDNEINGAFEKVEGVLLWYEHITGLSEENAIVFYNNELLAILRHFYKDKSILGFLRRFPHIDFQWNKKTDSVWN